MKKNMKYKLLLVLIVVIIAGAFLVPLKGEKHLPKLDSERLELLNAAWYNPQEKSYWNYCPVEDEKEINEIITLLMNSSLKRQLPLPSGAPAGMLTIGVKSGTDVIWIGKDGSIRVEKDGKLKHMYRCITQSAIDELMAIYEGKEGDQIITEKGYLNQ